MLLEKILRRLKKSSPSRGAGDSTKEQVPLAVDTKSTPHNKITLEKVIKDFGRRYTGQEVTPDEVVVTGTFIAAWEYGYFDFNREYTISGPARNVVGMFLPQESLGCCGIMLKGNQQNDKYTGVCTNPSSTSRSYAVPRDMLDTIDLSELRPERASATLDHASKSFCYHPDDQRARFHFNITEKNSYGRRYYRFVREEIDALNKKGNPRPKETLLALYREAGKDNIVKMLSQLLPETSQPLDASPGYARLKSGVRFEQYNHDSKIEEIVRKTNKEYVHTEKELVSMRETCSTKIDELNRKHHVGDLLIVPPERHEAEVQKINQEYESRAIHLVELRQRHFLQARRDYDLAIGVVRKLQTGEDIRKIPRHEYRALTRQIRVLNKC